MGCMITIFKTKTQFGFENALSIESKRGGNRYLLSGVVRETRNVSNALSLDLLDEKVDFVQE
jgi:transcriptional regulator CtsR